MKPQVLFGPFFVATPIPCVVHQKVEPLGISIEWATPKIAPRIALFRQSSLPCGPARLEHILVYVGQLPFSIECLDCHVLEDPAGTFLPLESVLAHLYQTHNGARCIFDLLSDLTTRIPIRNKLVRPFNRSGLLIPEVETRGYFLNTGLQGDQGLIAEIGWRPREGHAAFHVGLCKFGPDNPVGDAQWVSGLTIGISQLLSLELRRGTPGNPASLFTPLGLYLVSQLANGACQQLTA